MRTTERGAALLFTLFALALLGILASVLLDVDAIAAQREREETLIQIGHEYREALRRYAEARRPAGLAANRELQLTQLPQSVEDLMLDRRFPQPRRHLRRLYRDPMTGRAEWGQIRVAGRIVGFHSLSAHRPLKVDGFDVEDEALRGGASYRDWVFSPVPTITRPSSTASAPVS